MDISNPVKEAIAAHLPGLGFKYKAGTWSKDQPDVAQYLRLQKSNYGQQYYINIGIWLKDLGKEMPTKENEWHIRTRAESLVDSTDVKESLDLDSQLSYEFRAKILKRVLCKEVSEFFALTDSRASIAAAISSDRLRGAAIKKKIADLLASPA